uniref:Uncharacterized protein n=1 Tax=viral metagenome TaxID=1070528 RepID=A0A6C0DAB7_9ZZZZ
MLANILFKNVKTKYLSYYPRCKDCIHYIKYEIDLYCRCKKFTFENIITDELENEYADYVRRSRSKCDHTGKYFVSSKNNNSIKK